MAFCDRFNFYCAKVLPLVYDESLSYYEVLCKLADYIKELSQSHMSLEDLVNTMNITLQDLATQFPQYKAEIDAKLKGYETNNQNFQNSLKSDFEGWKSDLQTSNAEWQAEQNNARLAFQQQLQQDNTQWQQTESAANTNFRENMTDNWNTFQQQVNADLSEMANTLDRIKNGEELDWYETSLKNWIDNNLQTLVAKIVRYVSFGLDNKGRFVAYIPPSWQFLHFGTVNNPDSDLYGHLTVAW